MDRLRVWSVAAEGGERQADVVVEAAEPKQLQAGLRKADLNLDVVDILLDQLCRGRVECIQVALAPVDIGLQASLPGRFEPQ